MFNLGKPASTGSLFGANQQNSAGTNTGTGSGFSFGQQSNNATAGTPATTLGGANTGGLFGNKPAAGGSMFGNNNSAATGGGLFGAKPAGAAPTGGLFGNNTAQQPAATGGLFGAKPAGAAPATGGLFGNNTAQAAPATGGLFGNNTAQAAPATGGLFGNTAQTAPATGGLFGAKPAGTTTGGLFGAKPAGTTTGGLFGNNTAGSAPATGGLFGAKPAGTTGGLFGNNNTLGGATGGLFGNQQQQQQQQQQLSALQQISQLPVTPMTRIADLPPQLKMEIEQLDQYIQRQAQISQNLKSEHEEHIELIKSVPRDIQYMLKTQSQTNQLQAQDLKKILSIKELTDQNISDTQAFSILLQQLLTPGSKVSSLDLDKFFQHKIQIYHTKLDEYSRVLSDIENTINSVNNEVAGTTGGTLDGTFSSNDSAGRSLEFADVVSLKSGLNMVINTVIEEFNLFMDIAQRIAVLHQHVKALSNE